MFGQGIKYKAKGFKTEEEAKEWQEKHGGIIYSKRKNGQLHLESAILNSFDPFEFPYSVNWTETSGDIERFADE